MATAYKDKTSVVWRSVDIGLTDAMLYVVAFFVVLFALLYRHVTRNFNYWKSRGISYVKPVPFFGNGFTVFMHRESIGDFLHRIYKSTQSPYLGFFGFDQPFLLIRDPEIVKAVLVKDFEYFSDRSLITNNQYDKLGKDILFVIKNPEWKQLRTSMSPVFTTGKLKQMLLLMNEVGEELISSMKSKDGKISGEFIMNYSTDVISTCAFGIQAHSISQGDSEIKRVVGQIFDPGFNRSLQRACCFFAPFLVKMLGFTFFDVKSSEYLAKMFWDILEEREASKSYRGDLIDILIKIRAKQKGEEGKIEDQKLVAQAAQYIAAGIETIDITIFLTLYTLTIRPDIQFRLRQEIDTCLKDKELNYESIQELKYLEMVVREVLRMYPVLPYLDRRCVKDYQLPGTDVKIDRGIPIYLSLYGLQRDPKYFPEPDKFIPERFAEKSDISAMTYFNMPFGVGPRNCPGEKFGMLSSKMAIIKIMQNFELLPTDKTPIPLNFGTKGVVLQPTDDFHINFKAIK